MARSETPILDLITAPPAVRAGVSARGLLIALPAAIGVVALIPAAIYLKFVLGLDVPPWLGEAFSPITTAAAAVFQDGPLVGIISIWGVMFLGIVVHEIGHALAAIVLSWPLLEFRAAPFSLKRFSGRWKLRLLWNARPPALVMADPTTVRFHSKVRFYALAGPAINLATGILVGALSGLSSSAPPVALLFAGWSVALGLLNLLPLHLRGMELDGYVAFVVSRSPKKLAARVAAIKMRNYTRSDKPLELMNQRWVALAEDAVRASLQSRGGLWLAYSYWLGRDQAERAARILEKLLQQSHHSDERFRAMLFAESAVISAVRGRPSVANTWRERAAAFVLPDLLLHRCDTYVARVNNDINKARVKATLTREAASKITNRQVREAFLRDWDRWTAELDKSPQAAPDTIPNPPLLSSA